MKKGFTLIEAVIYIGLLALIMSSAVAAAYGIIGSHDTTMAEISETSDLQFLLEKINREPDPVVFIEQDSGLYIKRGSQDPILVSGKAVISDFLIQKIIAGSGAVANNLVTFFCDGIYFQIIPGLWK